MTLCFATYFDDEATRVYLRYRCVGVSRCILLSNDMTNMKVFEISGYGHESALRHGLSKNDTAFL